jgi:hypothetical protein
VPTVIFPTDRSSWNSNPREVLSRLKERADPALNIPAGRRSNDTVDRLMIDEYRISSNR